jgi:predicted RNase H-like HicB family nuclease
VYLEFSLFGRIRKERGWYIAQCPPLDLSTQGRTAAEARRNLQEASELFLTSCVERGTLDRAFRELRFSRAKRKIAARPRGSFPVEVTIPLRTGKVA